MNETNFLCPTLVGRMKLVLFKDNSSFDVTNDVTKERMVCDEMVEVRGDDSRRVDVIGVGVFRCSRSF